MTTTGTLTDIAAAILDGSVDADLDAIIAAVNERKNAVGRCSFDTIKVGSNVTLKNVKPLFLVGAPATVTSKKQTRIEIQIDAGWLAANPQARSRWSGVITVKPSMLKVVL